MWIIVGLGNPGSKYANTRHNAGHMVVDELSAASYAPLKTHKSRCHLAEARLGIGAAGAPGLRAIIAQPDSYMNESGGPVKALLQFYSASPEQLLVVHDDLDLTAHTVRLKFGGGEGGHNGLRSISSALGTRNYHRLRMGIGRPPGQMDVIDYVLGRFPQKEAADWQVTVANAAAAATAVVVDGFDIAQRELHSKG